MARVKRLKFRNIVGIDELEIEPGKWTVLEGGNAAGKTSALLGLASISEGGHDPTLLRQGEEEGEVWMLIEDVDEETGEAGELDGVEIRKRIKRDESTLDVKDPKRGPIGASKTFVDEILDAVSFNPVKFLTSDDRVEILLEAIDARVDEDQLLEAVGDVQVADAIIAKASDRGALDAIDAVRKEVYDKRTGVNRVAREKRTTADELRDTLPGDGADPQDIEEELAEAEAALEAERAERDERLEAVRSKTEKGVEELQRERDAEVERLQKEIERVRNEYQEGIDEARMTRDERVKEIEEAYGFEISQRQDLVSTLRERLKAVEGASRTREMIQEAETTAEEREAEADEMTAALGRLDELKERLLEDLPIEDAEVRDGELYVGGIPFDRLNSAKQADCVVQIAEARAGDLKLMVVDDLELLDKPHFEAMAERIKASPLQAIVTRVREDGGPLRVRNE